MTLREFVKNYNSLRNDLNTALNHSTPVVDDANFRRVGVAQWKSGV